MNRLIALTVICALAFCRPVYADEVAAQGNVLEDINSEPYLCYTTGYYSENTHGCRGDKMHEGIAAMAPELYGYAAIIYEAIPTDDGFEIGDFLKIVEIKDTGYGYSTGDGQRSKIRKDKKSTGTIEAGLHVDVYYETYGECKEWMNVTQGYVYVQLVPDVKG